jgi:hypothetical protein
MTTGSPVPDAWTTMVAHLAAAQVADGQRKDRDLPQTARDEATVRYSREVDAIFACLSELREAQVLGQITLMLARKERR